MMKNEIDVRFMIGCEEIGSQEEEWLEEYDGF